jgi:hypothetical protein
MDHAKTEEFIAAEKVDVDEHEFENDDSRETPQPVPVDAETLKTRQRVIDSSSGAKLTCVLSQF